MKQDSRCDFGRVIYVFQGGGALGAYQVGVTKALIENHFHPPTLGHRYLNWRN